MVQKIRHQMRKKGVFLLLFLFLSTGNGMHFESNIPDVGQEGQFVITNDTELYIGKVMMHKIYSTDLVSTDPVLSEYLSILGGRIAAAAPHCDFKFFYFPLETSELNAFAFFGGHVAVHTGLIMMVENESELAAVMAHETAHVTQRHLARILTKQKKLSPLILAELLAAAAIGMVSPDAGVGLATAALGGQTQQMINYTRDHEYEADRFAVAFLSKAGFDPMALPAVFKHLHNQTRFMEKPPEYLLTHPLFENRMADAYNRAEKLPAVKQNDSLFFHLVRARIESGSYESPTIRVRRLKDKLESGRFTNKLETEYAYALSLAKARRFIEAKQLLNHLIANNRHEQEVWILALSLADIEKLENNHEASLSILEELMGTHPKHLAIALQYADNLFDLGHYSKALDVLLKLNPKQLENPQVYQCLAKTYGKMGHPTAVHQNKAEWHFLRGEYKVALQQLDWALEKAGHRSIKSEVGYRKAMIQHWMSREKEAKL